ncbi:unnamed protein product [Caenorhabditis auriculariae]|uniref:Uncharacterized protein n=1 Tax=Caenorhabditis auriculariae TaxID=2777116 RepID=A0A8S1HFU0_9PELO|nr:unnamed protein product [Caenorhabditis auriculariae]
MKFFAVLSLLFFVFVAVFGSNDYSSAEKAFILGHDEPDYIHELFSDDALKGAPRRNRFLHDVSVLFVAIEVISDTFEHQRRGHFNDECLLTSVAVKLKNVFG